MKIIEIVLITAGLAALLAYAGVRGVGEYERQQAVAAFTAAPAPALRVLDASPPDQSDWSAERIAAYEQAAADRALAVLRVPGAGLEVPVFGDASERNLNRGAGYIPGTALPGSDGNAGIAAHRDGYFRKLQDVALGDVVTLEHPGGIRRYEITELAVVEPTDVSPLDPTDHAALTLVTCYPFYFVGSAPQRYIVRAVAIN